MTEKPFTGSPFRTTENPAEPPPRRRGRPPGSGRKRKSLKNEIGGTLLLVNMAIQTTPLSRDALDAVEIEALAIAIDEQAKLSPTFRKYVEYVVGITGAGGSLIGVVGIIGARRAARHNIIPNAFDAQLGTVLQLTIQTRKQPTTPEPEPEPESVVEPPKDENASSQ